MFLESLSIRLFKDNTRFGKHFVTSTFCTSYFDVKSCDMFSLATLLDNVAGYFMKWSTLSNLRKFY